MLKTLAAQFGWTSGTCGELTWNELELYLPAEPLGGRAEIVSLAQGREIAARQRALKSAWITESLHRQKH